ncbi:hypothetical protein T35B1_11672 [Salinisphaera shabanensis T35B1]|uniref:hypothetical protein n=1 Tax=Salinisphaera TaxID=180541 RepID=UPI00333EB23E
MSQPLYQIRFNDQLYCETHWPPMAQTAWHRVSRDRSSADPRSDARIYKDEQLLARTHPMSRLPRDWPDTDTPKAGWHDVVKKLLLLLREQGWGPREIAEAMTAAGLPTSRSRIDALRGNTKSVEVTPAELVVMLDVVTHNRDAANDD